MSEWLQYRLTDLAGYHNGRAFKPSDWSEDGLPIIRIEQLNNPHGPSDKYPGSAPEINLVRDGDLIFSWSATLKVLIWRHGCGVLNQHLFKVVPKHGFDLRFVFFLLDWHMDRLGGSSHGSTMKHIRRSELEKFYVQVPSIGAQERIATILTGIDTAIEKTEALIAKYQQIKAGLMHDLFTRGVLPSGQLRPPREQAPELYQETAIGWIPREWSASNCSREFVIESGITLGQHRRPNKRPRAYLRVANVHRDELRLEDLAFLEVLPNESVPTLEEFDLLIVEGHANRAEIGRCAMVTSEAAGLLFQNHLFRLRPHRLNHFYALDWLNSHHAMQHWETMCSTSSGLNTINRRMLGRMFVAAPLPEEQVRIAQKSIEAKKLISAESQKLRKLQAQKSGLMHDLLTGKVPVKVKEPEMADG